MQETVEKILDRMALAADGLLVNGVTMGLSPLSSAPGFLKRLAGGAGDALREASGQLQSLQPRPRPEVEAALAELRPALERMGNCLVSLTDYRSLPPERVDSLTAELSAAYEEFKKRFCDLEELCGAARSFYDSRPSAAARRIDELLHDLPHLLAEQRAAV